MSGKRSYFKNANKYQNKLLWLIFLSIMVPLGVMFLALYFLVLKDFVVNLPAEKVKQIMGVFCVLVPLIIVAIWLVAYIVTNKAVGSLDRLAGEIARMAEDGEAKLLTSRRGDFTDELVNILNQLFEKLAKR